MSERLLAYFGKAGLGTKKGTLPVAMEFSARLAYNAEREARNIAALPEEILAAFEVMQADALTEMSTLKDRVVAMPFEVYEGAGEEVSFTMASAAIEHVRLRKVEDKEGQVTTWLVFAVKGEGREAQLWAAGNVGKWLQLKIK